MFQTFGQTHNSSDSRMTTERCAFLCAIAIANNLHEVWMAKFPIVLLAYFSIYCPNWAMW